MTTMILIAVWWLMLVHSLTVQGILYPYESPSREVKTLDGIWNFVASPLKDQDLGFNEKWYSSDLYQHPDAIPMPVPSSYNDVTQDKGLRDHIGWVWYQRGIYVPAGWKGKRVVLRVGSAHYNAVVYVNNDHAMNHTIGHLPFECEVSSYVKYGELNHVTIAVNNTLTTETIPQGHVTCHNNSNYPPGYCVQDINFDFFNYAGIHRPVLFYTTPASYISDVTVTTTVATTTGTINYAVQVSNDEKCSVAVTLLDKTGNTVTTGTGNTGKLTVINATLWWPYLMHTNPGYLYTLHMVINCDGGVTDSYTLPVGIRELTWNNSTLLINNVQLYLRGFGKHEDSNIRGKGLDLPLLIKDFNLIKWLGGNSFRTSHYPYADEWLMMADELGIVIILECPAVALHSFDSILLDTHIKSVQEMISRDKNHPSVIMWSIGNEPSSSQAAASDYFKAVADVARHMDATRPVTLVIAQAYWTDVAAQHVDIICVNRYFGWYQDTGHTEVIVQQLLNDMEGWYKKHNKPVIITEYGAGAIAGFHSDPSQSFTEDYQVELIQQYFIGFDQLREKGFFIGEMIWNFADFMTKQASTRVFGNRKGVLTRERQPKAGAHALRARYWKLAQVLDKWNHTETLPTSMYCR